MNYEKEFRDFYNKYSRLYNNDQDDICRLPYQNYPSYYNYIVHPTEKYKEPFIPASRFNIDRLTEKIGYERPEQFPYLEFRQITPYPKNNEVINQNKTPIQNEEKEYRQLKYEPTIPKPTEDDYRYYMDFINEKKEKRNKELYPQHIIDFTADPKAMNSRKEEVPFQNYLYQSYSNNYPHQGLSPIKAKIVDKHAISINPYTEKIGGYGPTQLMNNPIVYPLNTYRQMTKRFYTPTPFGSVGGAVVQSW